MTRKFQTLFFLTLLTTSASGQVVNSLSPDETNIYFHGLATVIRLAKESYDFHRVFVRGDASIVGNFPDSVDGLSLMKKDDSVPIDKIRIKDGEVIITIRPISIIRDEFTITFLAAKKDGRLGYGLYVCYYKYMPETQTYELRKIKKGIEL